MTPYPYDGQDSRHNLDQTQGHSRCGALEARHLEYVGCEVKNVCMPGQLLKDGQESGDQERYRPFRQQLLNGALSIRVV